MPFQKGQNFMSLSPEAQANRSAALRETYARKRAEREQEKALGIVAESIPVNGNGGNGHAHHAAVIGPSLFIDHNIQTREEILQENKRLHEENFRLQREISAFTEEESWKP